ncbi:MAG: histidine kinase [Chitinophagaceae bacterium]|nr:histidine kinase [Chitinophagaceae bacterium]
MKGLLKKELTVSIFIGASYFLLWAAALFISADFNGREFLVAYKYFCWQNCYVLFLSLLIFHVLLKFISRRAYKFIWIAVFSILVLLLLTAGYQAWLALGMRAGMYPEAEKKLISSGYIIRGIIYQLYGIAYFSSIKLLFGISSLKNRNSQLQLEKKTAELNYLKSQTNPQFLFNTLNNLYALAEDRSALTGGAILRLSEILRYMLYESDTNLVAIGKEIQICKEYIELEKMRYDDSLVIEICGEVEDPDLLIPPLLLIPLIENAFKHGVAETINKPFIHISYSIKERRLFFDVENSISRTGSKVIGLGNLRKQLDLLFTDYKLDINIKETSFQVSLYINLDSYAKV